MKKQKISAMALATLQYAAEHGFVVKYIRMLDSIKSKYDNPIILHELCLYKRSWYKHCADSCVYFTKFINRIEDTHGMRAFMLAYHSFMKYACLYNLYLRVCITSVDILNHAQKEAISKIFATKYKVNTVDVINNIDDNLIAGLIIECNGEISDYSIKRHIETLTSTYYHQDVENALTV